MAANPEMAVVAALVGNPGRASMLSLMMDGRAHTATELAAAANVTPATASEHLGRLLDGRLAKVVSQGRHRYYRLASPQVAQMLESIMVVTAGPAHGTAAKPRVPVDLRQARTCYDHLAGQLGVAMADAMIREGAVRLEDDSGEVTEHGHALFAELGVDLTPSNARQRRRLCRPCLDWSERRPHLAGVLGNALLRRMLALGWIEQSAGSRAILIRPKGARELRHRFGVAVT